MDPRLRVLEALNVGDGLTSTQVAGRTRLTPADALEVLESLMSTNVVTCTEATGTLHYRLNRDLAERRVAAVREGHRGPVHV